MAALLLSRSAKNSVPLFYYASGMSHSFSLEIEVCLIKFVRNILDGKKPHIKEMAEVFEIMKKQKVDIYIRNKQGYKHRR